MSAIFCGRTYARRLQVYSKLSFVITEHIKLVRGQKNFLRAWEPAKVDWVVDCLLRFGLKIGCVFTFHEMRCIFLAEIELY